MITNQPYSSDPSLVSQAQTILEAATSLQQHLDAASLPQPSFSPTGRRNWADAGHLPDLLQTRFKLIDAAQTMLDLAMGPLDTLAYYTGPTVAKLEILRTLDLLKVAEHVPLAGDISIDKLAERTGVRTGVLERHMRCAYLMGVFRESRKGYVAHTGTSAAMPDFSPYTQLGLGDLFTRGSFHVAETMKDSHQIPPIPIEIADEQKGGRTMWKQLAEDDPDGKGMEKFSEAMKVIGDALSGGSYVSFLQGFDWNKIGKGTVVDVGGGNGHISLNIARGFSDLHFVVQDLESNKQPATDRIKEFGLEDRVRFQQHDFFEAQPLDLQPAAYFMSRVLHDWQDGDCVRILKPLLPAMEQHGTKMVIMDRVLPDNVGEMSLYREWTSRRMDILMYTLFGAGERTRNDFETLFKSVDSRLSIVKSVQPVNTVFSFLEVELSK